MTQTAGHARFDNFVFDPESGELRSGNGVVRLQPQPAKVLELLLRDAGSVVLRETLKSAVWPETVVEFDQGLNYCIRQIRSALGDTVEDPRFIETLARRGYRFTSPVHWDAQQLERAKRPITRRAVALASVPLAAVALAVLLLSMTASVPMVTQNMPPVALPVAPTRVAVIPLREGDPDNPLTQRLIVELTATSARLEVLGPATTGRLRGDERSQIAMGAELGVDYIISGGIRSADSGLFVQAVRVVDGAHVFAQIIERRAVRSERAINGLARSIARSLRDDVQSAQPSQENNESSRRRESSREVRDSARRSDDSSQTAPFSLI